MTRVSRSDSLLTELRDIKRRLRLLEAARMRQADGNRTVLAPSPGPDAAAANPQVGVAATDGSALLPVPLPTARPVDWPATTSSEWERLAAVRLPASYAGSVAVLVSVVAEPGASGTVRVLLESAQVGDDLPVATNVTTHTLPVPGPTADAEIVVEARRLAGEGVVRVASLLIPMP
jgi:hypothetical protein